MTQCVVHFIDTLEFGGAERALLHLLERLDPRHWTQVLFHHDAPGLRPLLEGADAAGIRRRTVPPMHGMRGVSRLPVFGRALADESPVVFHAHLNWPLACSLGVLAARLYRVPAIVATVQLFSDLPAAPTIPLQRAVVTRMVDRYIAVSDAVRRDIEIQLRVAPSRIRCIPNGIALEPFAARPMADPAVRREMTERTDVPVVLTLARLHPQKGLRDLLQAAARLPDVAFAIAGDGPSRLDLQAEARELGVDGRVSFLGFRTDTPRLLANADVFVLPSLIEGLPLSVLEAMAAGLPVICTDAGGTGELVRHRETGLLVPPSDSEALARAIRELLGDRPLAERLAAAGRALVAGRYSAAGMADAVASVYREVHHAALEA